MTAGDACRNCGQGRVHSYGDGVLKCTLCGWSADAYRGYPLPSKSEFWLAAQDRGVSWEQFDQEWAEYQAGRVSPAAG